MDGSAQAFTEATANPSRLLDLTSVRRRKTVDEVQSSPTDDRTGASGVRASRNRFAARLKN